MALMVCPNEGKLLCLTWMLTSDGSDFSEFLVALFVNDYTPDDDSTFVSFVGASFTGSDPITIEREDFDTPTIDSNVGLANVPAAPAWTSAGGGSQTVYGWFMYTAATGKVVFCQRFDSPRAIGTGVTLSLDPFTIKLRSFTA